MLDGRWKAPKVRVRLGGVGGKREFLESLIKMLESSADTDYEGDDAYLKSWLDSKKEEYGKEGLRGMLKWQLADNDLEIFCKELMPDWFGDMSKESYQRLLELIKTMNTHKLVSYINHYLYES